MSDLEIGTTVRITSPTTMTGNVGTVVHYDEKRERYLVRIDAITQNYFPAEELEVFDSGR